LPVRASMANMTFQPRLPYMTPFDTRGVVSTLAPAGDSVPQVQANPPLHVARVDLFEGAEVRFGVVVAIGRHSSPFLAALRNAPLSTFFGCWAVATQAANAVRANRENPWPDWTNEVCPEPPS
jgi:hypothetical protein